MSDVPRKHFCSCGQIVSGRRAKREHRWIHNLAADGHVFVSMDVFRQLFPDWRGGSQSRRDFGRREAPAA